MNNQGTSIFLWALLSIALVIFSCGGTTVKTKDVRDTYKGEPVSNILVIAVTGNEHNRRLFENHFARKLQAIGVDAVASEKILPMPPDLRLNKEMIIAAVKKHDNNAVIITQLISGETKEVEIRDVRSYHGYFYDSRPSIYSSTSTTLRLETNLYEVKTENLIWSGISDTWSQESTDQIISEVIHGVINNLKEKKIIAPN